MTQNMRQGQKTTFPPSQAVYLRYRKGRVYGDFLRSFLGLAFGFIGVVFLQALWWVDMIFASVGLLFTLYLWQTINRTLRPLAIDDEAIYLGMKTIAWCDIEKIKLRHYGGHKYSTVLGSGFFELSVSDGKAKIACDSGIDGFNNLLKLLQRARDKYDIAIDDSSIHNLLYLTQDSPQDSFRGE